MKIGVLSDSHDNLINLVKALDYLSHENIDTAIFCGDFCSPVPIKLCIAKYSGTVHAVYGNTEDRHLITHLALTQVNNLKIYGEYADLNFEERRVGVTHYPFYAQALARTGDYDAVFYGHQHTMQIDQVGDCLLANPGEIMGFKEEPGFGIYDTKSNEIETFKLKDLG